jgi:2-methylfumaryl-CoA isomerase
MYQLLKGLKIVEGASFIAAPLCGLTFVQLGADVIRFDPIEGGPDWPLAPSGASFYWEGLNKGKRSIAIDLGRPEGREIAEALATATGTSAGLFITNYPTVSFLSHRCLSARRRDVIVVRVTGSSDGRTALDYTVNCSAGYPGMTGPPDATSPINHVLPAWDIAAGLTAAVSLLAAMHSRTMDGKGREIQVPLSNVAFGILSALGNLAEVAVSGRDRPRYGNALFGSFGRDFSTADKRRIMVVAITRRQWSALVKVLELSQEIATAEAAHCVRFETDEGARFTHREELFALVQSRIGMRNLSELAGAFDREAVCWGEYQTIQNGLQRDPRLSDVNPMFQYISHASGETYITAGFPGVLSDTDRVPVRPAPQLGAHTDEILAVELGMTDREIGVMHDRCIVAGPHLKVRSPANVPAG